MEEITQTVKGFTLEQGADVVGVGSAEAMNTEARKLQRPEENLTGAKTIVSLGIRMLNSIFKSSNIRVSRASYVYLHDSLDDIAWKVAGFLEERGFDAIPIASDVPVEMMERGGLLGDISHRHAAVQAGLGRVGLSGHFLSPRFGPRVRLVSVITTAPLLADEPLKDDICRGEKCRKCIEACPANAISKTDFEAKRCLSVMHKYNLYGLLKLVGKVLDTEDSEEKKRLIFDRTFSEIYMSLRSGDPPFCIKCVEVCPMGKPK